MARGSERQKVGAVAWVRQALAGAVLLAGAAGVPAEASPEAPEAGAGGKPAFSRLQEEPGRTVEAEPELLTDRPDFTETSFAVPRGSLQLESGFTYTDEGGSGGHVLNLPELLIRYGFAPRTELRIGTPEFVRVRNGGRIDGMSDMSLGFKRQFGPDDAPYGYALIGAVSLPVGEGDLTSDAA